ncbi:zinc finger protein 704-like isoform X2 [Oncorhynchus keta]|uniref:zinc finger protein 704-like isoform X2 n=1 Tax=Oncorhynchus keta TaxID=8018 RepID=UPI0015FDF79E|nr:zinc finger protein 704-like isoform X2 [Oncorhynchus keta]
MMNSKRLLDMSAVGIRLGGASKQAGIDQHAEGFKGRKITVAATADSDVILACKNGPATGAVFYKFVLDDGSLRECTRQDTVLNANDLSSGREKYHLNKAGCGGEADERNSGLTGILTNGSPTHSLIRKGQKADKHMHSEARDPLVPSGCQATNGQQVPPEERDPHPSSQIPVPRRRKPSGLADKEVMAATVLTSLSTSPLVLTHTQTASAAVPEPASRGWKEVLSTSYSSSTSGNWSWDTSDQSVPSTPSPPLSNDTSKSFLLSSQSDNVIDDVKESTHFLFEDPIPRKRKNSVKVMLKCLWKNCEKVLSTSSGIQRHIRTVHLGRNCDSDYSDGEEDFYYSEIEVNMDSLSEGLSSLTPTSPTTTGPPPIFPPFSHAAFVPRSEPAHIVMRGPQGHAPSLLSQSAPSTLCHIRTDHAYQGPLTHIRTVSFGEKRQPAPHTHTTICKTPPFTAPLPKPAPGIRKPRGEAKKCRKVYGMEKRDMWCTACRWKKACQRFTD